MEGIWKFKLQHNNSQDANSIISPPPKSTWVGGVRIAACSLTGEKNGAGSSEAVVICQHI